MVHAVSEEDITKAITYRKMLSNTVLVVPVMDFTVYIYVVTKQMIGWKAVSIVHNSCNAKCES